MPPFRALLSSLILSAAMLAGVPACADDQPFLTLYTTDIDTQGEREAEQSLYWKAEHSGESYSEFLSRSEIEYGITDDFQGSLYVNYDYARAHAPPSPAESQSHVSVSGELIYRVLNVYFDPVGLAFYLEPSYGPDARELEAKVLLQKNFFNDTLRFAFNANFEDHWDRIEGSWQKSSALEFDAGLSYNVTPEFSAGVEFDNERAMNGLVLGGASSEQTGAYYLGPTLYYIAGLTKIAVGAETQLPFAANPSHTPGAIENGFVSDAERYRVIVKLSRDF